MLQFIKQKIQDAYFFVFAPNNVVRYTPKDFGWYDADTKIEMCLVKILFDFVEQECSHMYCIFCDDDIDYKKLTDKEKSEYGVKHLRYDFTKEEDYDSNYSPSMKREIKKQEKINNELADCYLFFKSINIDDDVEDKLLYDQKTKHFNTIIKYRQYMWT